MGKNFAIIFDISLVVGCPQSRLNKNQVETFQNTLLHG